MAKRKRRRWLIPLLLLLAGAAVFFLLRRGGGSTAYTQETARIQDIVTYYTFSGNLTPKRERTVYAAGEGTVRAIRAPEGSQVSDGDTVLTVKGGERYEAPMNGMLADLWVEEQESFEAGDALFRVADFSRPVLMVKIDEYDVSSLSVGMPVEILIHAADVRLSGSIRRIAREASVENDLAYYEVEIQVPEEAAPYMGMTCEITAERESALQAVAVPMEAVQYDSDSLPFVWQKDGEGKIVQRRVSLGINNGTVIQVTEGLAGGETVWIPISLNRFMTMRQNMINNR